ncbi:MAG: hypothetical protein KME08_15745 [Aphanothece sp. CMT-3BRIN-NPC111]|jgi:hypothetical protein|nr:hypothetical protein [Aphanothece sp. CMT-3BRIN-NPC111]
MTTIDDKTLIHNFIRGEGELLSNQNLRVDSAFDTTQLLAKNGELVALIKPTVSIPSVSVNLASKYWELTHQILLKNSFVPVGQPERQGVMKYEQHELPAGYKVNYTSAKILWREWWIHHRLPNRRAIQLDVLILAHSQWYPIRGISYNPDELFFKTLVDEVRLHHEDKVIWLTRSQVTEDQRQVAPIQSPPISDQSTPSQAFQIDPLQREYAETIRSIAISAFKECVDSGIAKEVKPGVWFVKGANYNLAYEDQTNTLAIAAGQRGVICKYRGETLESAANLEEEDIKYWQKINEKFKNQKPTTSG